MSAAANSYAATSKKAKVQSAADQGRRVHDPPEGGEEEVHRIATDLRLETPSGAASAARKPSAPVKGAVRSVSMVVKGYYRTIGGASTATAQGSATFAQPTAATAR